MILNVATPSSLHYNYTLLSLSFFFQSLRYRHAVKCHFLYLTGIFPLNSIKIQKTSNREICLKKEKVSYLQKKNDENEIRSPHKIHF